ncbi:MAG: DNA internalization-related competence protein ComEC/Rec2, partial [bacterium]
MRNQPFLPVAIALSAGIVCAEYTAPAPSLPFSATIVFLLLAFAFRRKSLTASVFLYCAAFSFGITLLLVQNRAIKDQRLTENPTYSKITAFGSVISEPIIREDRVRYTLMLKAFKVDTSWHPANGRLQVMMKTPEKPLQIYEEVYATGNLIWPLSERNPGDFNYKRYLNLQGIQALLRIRYDGRVVRTGLFREPLLPVRKWINTIHKAVGQGLDKVFDSKAAAVLRGLLLGDHSEIDPAITEDFARSGVIHILAVSGLHVGFVIVICIMIGWLFRLKERDLVILTFCVIWIYAVITGVKPPVVRASVMASVFMIGRYRDKPVNAGNLLAFAAILLLIFRPGEIFQAGFQLSFSAVAGILFLYPKINSAFKSYRLTNAIQRYKFGRWILGLIAISLAAQIGTLPFSSYHFGRVSLFGVFANLVVIPAIFLAIISAIISLLLLPFSTSLAQFIGAFPNGLILLVIWLTNKIAGLGFTSLENWYPPIWILLLYITVVVALFYWRNNSTRFALITISLLILNGTVWYDVIAGGPKLKVVYLNVGQGDASFIQTPSGQNILIDAGPASPDYDTGKEVILPFFKRWQIEKIDAVFITHAHIDHYGGLFAILNAMPVSKVVFADTTYYSKAFTGLLKILQAKDVPIYIAKRGQIIEDFSPVEIWVA